MAGVSGTITVQKATRPTKRRREETQVVQPNWPLVILEYKEAKQRYVGLGNVQRVVLLARPASKTDRVYTPIWSKQRKGKVQKSRPERGLGEEWQPFVVRQDDAGWTIVQDMGTQLDKNLKAERTGKPRAEAADDIPALL